MAWRVCARTQRRAPTGAQHDAFRSCQQDRRRAARLNAQAGNRRSEYGLSHSASLGNRAALRAHGSYKRMDGLETPEGTSGFDEAWIARGGARLDWEGAASSFTLSGDLYDGEFGSLISLAVPQPPFQSVEAITMANTGGHVLARFRRGLADGSSLTVSGYYDFSSRVAEIFDEDERTLDLELQHELRLGGRHQVVWGVGYRHVEEEGLEGVQFEVDPTRHTEDVLNAFAQGELTLTSSASRPSRSATACGRTRACPSTSRAS